MGFAASAHRDGGRAQVVSPALVGREDELAALRAALADAAALVVVEGEAGVGKSRLLREALASPGDPVGRVLFAVCPPFRVPFTLGPVVDAIREAASEGVAGLRLSGLAGALRSLFPEWADDLPGPLEPAEDALAARHRLFRALAELLDCLDVAVLVVDDVHWADEATVEFLLFLASRPRPLSLVVAYRPEDLPADSLLPRLYARPQGEAMRLRLGLGPLDVAGTARLMSSMLAWEPVSEAFARLVHDQTEGLPLAVEESVRLMSDRTDLIRRGGEWVRTKLSEIHVPPTVRDAVLERARRLGPGTRALLRAAAVVMDAAPVATLAAVAELAPAQARFALTEALGRGLLEERASGQIGFRHVLAARAVYDSVPPPDRRLLHQRAGAALETWTRPPVAQLALHFKQAGDRERWASYAERAVDIAAAAGDWVAVAALVHELMSDADLPPTAMARLAAKIPSEALTDPSQARDVERALRSALASGSLDTLQAAMTRHQLSMVLEWADNFDESRHVMELAIPDLPKGSLELVRGMMLLGRPHGSSTCAGHVHREWLHRAAHEAEALPAVHQPEIAERIAIALLLLGQPEGWEMAAGIPHEVSTPEQRRTVTRRDLNMADLAMRWGRYALARTRADSALRLADEHGYPRYRTLILTTSLWLDWLTGTWEGLAERAGELVDADDTMPVSRLEASMVTGLLLKVEGRSMEAVSVLQEVLVGMHDLGAAEFVTYPAAALAWLHLTAGRTQEALRVTEELIDLVVLKDTWLWATELAPARLDALVAAGRGDEAAKLVTDFAAGVRGRDAPAPEAGLMLCQGILAASEGEHLPAASWFEHAAEAWDALPRPYDALLTRERQARSLLAAGRDEDGIALLTRVSQGMAELGARGDAARVVQALRQHGVDAKQPWRGGSRGYGDRLSPRETDVARLVVLGRTNREIAEALFLSPRTVARHMDSAMRKFGVSSRTALAMKVVEVGIVPASDATAP